MNNPWLHFAQFIKHPQQNIIVEQEKWLTHCINLNKSSAYGKLYRFDTIKNTKDYQTQVPVVDYQTLSPWIDKLLLGDSNLLFTAQVIAFEKTSGSHSAGKLIPYTAQGLSDFRMALLGWLAQLINQFKLTEGTAYWALSPAMQQTQFTAEGIPIGGGDALYLGEENLQAFSKLSAVPLSIGEVSNIKDWQLLTLYYLLCSEDLRLISIWSPSFFIQLLEALTIQQQPLLELLSQGGKLSNHTLEKNLQALKRYQLYLQHKKTNKLWPRLAVISCWADASSRALAKQLMDYFPEVHLQPKGLLSTEAIITIPNNYSEPLLCVNSNFYEFMDNKGDIYLADGLIKNTHYQVVVTTNSGLYRYNTGDIVQCRGYREDTPLLSFIGRAGIVSDMVGEKLTEPFVNQCLSRVKGFAMLCPNKQTTGYILLLDKKYFTHHQQLVAAIEQQLCNNPQYAYARKLAQLAPLACEVVTQPIQRYLKWQHAKGKRLGDIKIPALLAHDNWQQIFDENK